MGRRRPALAPADMAKRLLWCALWRTQPMETQGFRGNLPGCVGVLDRRNAMAEFPLVAQSCPSSAKKKNKSRPVFDESSSNLGEKDGMIRCAVVGGTGGLLNKDDPPQLDPSPALPAAARPKVPRP